jgi:hypothetical protein
VHLFLVQESMNLDALQAVSATPDGVLFSGLFTDYCIVCFTDQVVDALTVSVRAMHPQVHVALVTFSNRIGIYR